MSDFDLSTPPPANWSRPPTPLKPRKRGTAARRRLVKVRGITLARRNRHRLFPATPPIPPVINTDDLDPTGSTLQAIIDDEIAQRGRMILSAMCHRIQEDKERIGEAPNSDTECDCTWCGLEDSQSVPRITKPKRM